MTACLPSPFAHETIAGFFAKTAATYPERAFLHTLSRTAEVYGIDAGSITYAQMSARVEQRTNAYARAGYGPGHRIGLLVENRPVFFEHWLALNRLGASLVPVNPDLQASELRYLVEHSELALAVAIPSRQADMIKAGAPAVIGPDDPIPKAISIITETLETDRREAALLYTSGTTGLPKGCVLTNQYFLTCAAWYRDVGGACAISEAGERMITPLPLFHMNAMACSAMGMIAVGGCLSVIDRFHPSSWWDDIREADATVMHYLGVMPAMLMNAAPGPADQNHSLRFGFGAGVEKPLHGAFEARFGVPLVEAWAMTETGNGAVIAAAHGARHVGSSCFGTPAPEVEVRLAGGDGEQVAQGRPGELLVRRAGDDPHFGFFDRYLKNPGETAKAWEGGWFHTGDIARQNPDGSYVFVDRKKNVIRRSGENIAAIEVEGVLNRHANIAACAVTATPDALRGDEVFACIKLTGPVDDPGQVATDIMRYCLDQLAYYKAPGYIAFVPELPLTSTNKIQRGAMKPMVAKLRDAPGTINTTHLKKRKTP
ncbi:MAG: AMP-binding protein [Rhodobacteraceae bacterium]|nr:AMP-binding protein [Paracoccaceae bacterium]